MAKSDELKALIAQKIKREWENPNEGADWKEDVVDEKIFAKLANPKNWKRVYKGRNAIGEITFVIRQFDFGGEDSDFIICATVTCDENDNFLDIEFERQ